MFLVYFCDYHEWHILCLSSWTIGSCHILPKAHWFLPSYTERLDQYVYFIGDPFVAHINIPRCLFTCCVCVCAQLNTPLTVSELQKWLNSILVILTSSHSNQMLPTLTNELVDKPLCKIRSCQLTFKLCKSNRDVTQLCSCLVQQS